MDGARCSSTTLTDEVYANNAQSFGRGFWTRAGPRGAVGLQRSAASEPIADYRGRPREYGIDVPVQLFLTFFRGDGEGSFGIPSV